MLKVAVHVYGGVGVGGVLVRMSLERDTDAHRRSDVT